MKKLSLIFCASLLALASCSTDSSLGPENYPSVNGFYDMTATFDNYANANLNGTMTIIDDSRATPEFGGSFTFRVTGTPSPVFNSDVSGALVNGLVGKNNSFSTRFLTADFRATGTVDGSTIVGTITLFTDDRTYSGPFIAVRR